MEAAAAASWERIGFATTGARTTSSPGRWHFPRSTVASLLGSAILERLEHLLGPRPDTPLRVAQGTLQGGEDPSIGDLYITQGYRGTDPTGRTFISLKRPYQDFGRLPASPCQAAQSRRCQVSHPGAPVAEP